ncbi:hypothetical protein EPUS_07993 [Endocarpon pusillum Z07020]|uniref:Uncharacterized protein n=1 Tax=Endocarpon pusillum (strain Z07020 / HMAS-L-300199) TaxID=1263415 RepID=U1GWF0_ENDPU|nr:uncharacterized protein EPUS_07993 [Endocarpon pusillum Z07020]ERF76813.1 hypothetical protein EPUS_07993 [Endocarpon pusillum Z07020]
MRLAILRVLAVYLSSAALVVAQSQTEDPGPSPAASIGCVPHNDHWDCEGPRVTSSMITTTSAIPAASESTHDENAPVTGSNLDPGPSPTASIGCVPHGDHWDCEGPAPVSAASSSGSDSGILATATSTATTAATASSSVNAAAAGTSGSSTSSAPAQYTGVGSVVSLERYFVAALEAVVMGVGIFFAAA